MAIIIYDSNNWVRSICEKDFTGLGIRSCWSEACLDDGNVRIFVFDGRGGNNLRRTIYPEYKMKRELPKDTFFENLAFFKELLANAPNCVGVAEKDGFEGDDVIATLCKQMYPNPVVVMSTDKDLTAIPNASNPMANTTFCPKKYVHLYKTLVGDPSDNLHGVRGFGQATWEKLTENERDLLNDWFLHGCSEEYALRCVTINPKIWSVIQRASIQELQTNWVVTNFFDVPDLQVKFGDGKTEVSEHKLREVLL